MSNYDWELSDEKHRDKRRPRHTQGTHYLLLTCNVFVTVLLTWIMFVTVLLTWNMFVTVLLTWTMFVTVLLQHCILFTGGPLSITHYGQGYVLEGFKLSTDRVRPNKTYPPPTVPRDFKPRHVFHVSVTAAHSTTPRTGAVSVDRGRVQMDAHQRASVLGETPDIS